MSTTIDQRVVEMRFDNKHFESNVSETLSTLEKLKRSLNLSGASKGLDDIGAAARNCDVSGLASGVQAIQTRFSALEVMAVTALANITNTAVNAGKRIASALTIDPIKTGFQEYETQINAVQTILANTESKGTTLKDVTKALDELNTYADKTIYNFTEMTRNIGTFTAAGIDLDTSTKAIQGIANLAAVSGSTSQQASTAMYQLSQALAAGKVQLMDWNSVVNAGMGGQVFQDALKRTATTLGTNVDAMIKKYGSFRESLTKGEWLTAEVLTKTLEQFTMCAEEGSEQWNEFKKSLMDEGYTAKQAEEILKMANTATDAATKVKTFTQLWDTLKESAQSGWTQSWEIIVGDFEEAKSMLTNISNVVGGMIGATAEARNDLLQGWKDIGGRTDLIEGVSSAFGGLMNIVTAVGEAFREIFPSTTAEQLHGITEGFKTLMSRFEEFTSAHGPQIKSTFTGIFAVVDIFATVFKEIAGAAFEVIGAVAGLSGGILTATGSFGDWLLNLRNSIKETDIFSKAVDGATKVLVNIIDKFKEFGTSLRDSFEAPGYEGFVGFLKIVWELVQSIGSEAGKIFTSIADGVTEALGESSVSNMLSNGIFAAILVSVKKFVDGFANPMSTISDVCENVTDILDDVRGCFQAYQEQLKAGTLVKIATAVAILAGALLVISTINADDLGRALAGITVLFMELMGSLALFGKIDTNVKGVTKAIGLMTGMSVAITILSVALKNLSGIGTDGIIKGLIAIGVLMGELLIFLNKADFDGKITRIAVGITIISSAMLILAQVVEDFGAMNVSEISKGVVSIGALLTMLAIFVNKTSDAKHVITTGVAMIALAGAMKLFASAVEDFATMSWDEIVRGLTAMGIALAEIGMAVNFMPKNMVSIGVGMIAIGGAMLILADALEDLGGMTGPEIAKSLTTMGIALAELAIALNFMKGALGGSVALIAAAGALALMVPVLKSLGEMNVGEIVKSLITLAAGFAIIWAAGVVLAPLVPTLLGLSAAFALFGIATIGIGAGLTAIAAGFVALAAAGTAGATAIVAALSVIVLGIADLIPSIAKKIGEAIAAFCVVIAESAPQIVESLLILLTQVVSSLSEYAPQIINSLFTFLIGVINGLSERAPELITAVLGLVKSIFQGISDALSGIDSTGLMEGIAITGMLTILMHVLGSVVAMIPQAMLGILGMGVLIAELALVLAAVGALAQIPGLDWLISEGGDFLETIGTAIGQFVGGIVGGFSQGVTNSLPDMATDLSEFMKNLQPFIDGAKQLDSSMLEGIKALASSILALTAAEVLDGIASWLTGGSSISDFADQLVPFGKGLKKYSEAVADVNTNAIVGSAEAAKALSKVAENLPNSGGVVSWFTGDNDMSGFADQLVPFGKGLKQYSDAVVGIDVGAVTASVNSAKKVLSFIKSTEGLTISGVSTFSTALGQLAKISVDGFIAAFINAGPRVTTAGSSLVTALTTGINLRLPAISQTMSTMLTNMITMINTRGPQFQKSGVDVVERFIAGMNGRKARVKVVLNSVLSACTTAIRGFYQSFYNAGSYLVEGFAAGIKAQIAKAAAAASAMASAAATAAKSTLKVNSPSKVGYETGAFYGMGFVNAIKDYADKSYRAGSAMAESAKNGLGRSIANVRDMINDAMDVNPTVRPVLDLSEIQNGANQIGGLLANKTIALAGINASLYDSNLKVISDSMRGYKDTSNADIVSAISELRSDFGSLANAVANMRIQMDSGAVVGELIGKIDNSLGQIANHRGRGN